MVKLLTPTEAAEATGLTVIKILKLCKQRAFGRNTSTGKRPTWIIREDDLFNYFRADSPSEQQQLEVKQESRQPRIDAGVKKVF